jgi:molybdenum cofactor synthesis domain-containing protein
VAILSTGNEVVEPGEPLAPGQIYDINSYTLAAVVAEHGGVPVIHRTAVDTLEDLSRAVDECLAEDVLVFSGGSSVGTRDLMLDVLRAKGEVLFHGIAVKPGKPTAFGRIDGKLAFGMRATPRRASPTPTCCWCPCCAAWRACRRSRSAWSACRWRRA